ncbi:MAG: LysM domain-containing protein [Chlamydiota bacterium]|nr:LysM domain-containing protein [Chlamydiota bacterium]
MKKKKICFLFAISLVGCGGSQYAVREETQHLQVSLHKVKSDIDDLKHEVNSHEIDQHIIDIKTNDLEQGFTAFKRQFMEVSDSLAQEHQAIKAMCQQIEKRQDQIRADLKQLSSHAHDTNLALSQFKEKIQTLQKVVSHGTEWYIVKSGDSLEKIAQKHDLSVEQLKKMNNLQEDLIVVGQEIRIA